MDKINRLGWAAGVAFRTYGLSFGIRVSDRGVLDRVRALLPPRWKPTVAPGVPRLFSLIVGGPTGRPGLRRLHVLYRDSTRLLRTDDLEEALRLLELHVHLDIAERARRRTFVHAGVVGWNGRAILIPGRSWSGKSSLVRALVEAGATYYSDEFAVLDDRGRVHPYPIALAIRRAAPGVPPVKCRVEEIGGVAGTTPLPVGLIVLTRYVNGARFRPRHVSAGQAVLELLENTLPARRRPGPVLEVLSQAVSRARVVRGTRGEADQTTSHILSLAEGA